MQLSQTQIEPVTVNDIITWARDIKDEDLKSFINYRSNMLGDLDDDDFDLAAV